MQDHVGGVFEGTITGVTPFGLFVTLDEYFVDGLVHISELGRDYFQFDAARHMLLGERTKKRYRLADRMKVKLVRVDLESAQDRFRAGMKREREPRVVFGFHAVLARLRADPKSVVEIFLDETRHDARSKDLAAVAERAGVRADAVPTKRLDGFYGGGRHQGVVARVEVKSLSHSLDEILEQVEGAAAAAGARRRHRPAQPRRLPARGQRRRRARGGRAEGPRRGHHAPRCPRWRAARPRRRPTSWSPTSRARSPS